MRGAGLPLLPFPQQGFFMAQVLAAARAAGRKELMMNAAGQAAGMVRRISPAREILEEMVFQAAGVLRSLQGLTTVEQREVRG